MWDKDNKSLLLESWQISGIMRFVPLLLETLKEAERDGFTAEKIFPKQCTRKDLLSIVEFMAKFDKYTWMRYLSNEFFIAVNHKGVPLCRSIKKFAIREDDYLNKLGGVDNGNKE